MKIRHALGTAAVIALAVAAGGRPAPVWAGALDGKSFSVMAGEAGAKADEPDELLFAGDKFRSKGCDVYGFGDATYTTASRSDGSMTFEAETTSEKEGRMNWVGTVTGDSISGTFTWFRKPKWYRVFGKPTIEYTYSGQVRK